MSDVWGYTIYIHILGEGGQANCLARGLASVMSHDAPPTLGFASSVAAVESSGVMECSFTMGSLSSPRRTGEGDNLISTMPSSALSRSASTSSPFGSKILEPAAACRAIREQRGGGECREEEEVGREGRGGRGGGGGGSEGGSEGSGGESGGSGERNREDDKDEVVTAVSV